jgi:2-methylisocitrate lyase-like PEP mutase family enzyme
MNPDQLRKAAALAALHRQGCFVIPNAWDAPSALICADAGYPAVATSSVGVAFALGGDDGERMTRDQMIAAAGLIAARLDIPVTADLESGYGATPRDVAETVRLAVRAGLVGCNIEDRDHASGVMFDPALAAERIQAAAEAARDEGLPDFVINARSDAFFVMGDRPEAALAEATDRGRRYLAAGGACFFVPGIADAAMAGRLVQAVRGPVSLMAGLGPTSTVAQFEAAGVRRISLGPALMGGAYQHIRVMLDGLRASGEFGFAPEAGAGFGALRRLMQSKG